MTNQVQRMEIVPAGEFNKERPNCIVYVASSRQIGTQQHIIALSYPAHAAEQMVADMVMPRESAEHFICDATGGSVHMSERKFYSAYKDGNSIRAFAALPLGRPHLSGEKFPSAIPAQYAPTVDPIQVPPTKTKEGGPGIRGLV